MGADASPIGVALAMAMAAYLPVTGPKYGPDFMSRFCWRRDGEHLLERVGPGLTIAGLAALSPDHGGGDQ